MPDSHNRRPKWDRPGVWCGLFCLILLIGVVTVLLLSRERQLSSGPQIAQPSQTDASTISVGDPKAMAAPNVPAGGQEKGAAVPAGASSTSPVILPEPTPQTRQLVRSLSRLDQLGQGMTSDQAQQWKKNLQQLIDHGQEAVPAIVEFLKQNKDVDLAFASEALGYASVRRAMFDALGQIGGAEAIFGTLQTLQNTADPHEIAWLAQNLEKLAPGEHREEIFQAARESLDMAASGKLEGIDVGPLFETLQKFGGGYLASEIQQKAGSWNYYAAIALAQLADGEGIPALIQMAQGDSIGQGNAIEMLAQTSMQYPLARDAFLQMVKANAISPSQWPYLTRLLSGEEYYYQDSTFDGPLPGGGKRPEEAAHVLFGNQHFYTAPPAGGLTQEQVSQRMAFLDELQAATSDPAALRALDETRELLTKRLPQTVVVIP